MTRDHDSDGTPRDGVHDEGAVPRGEVVRLADVDPRHPGRIAAELRTHWEGLRKGKAIPARTDVEPQGIRRALDYAFILERIAPGAARFRLAGRHLIDLMGMEVRGMPVCAFFNPASRGRLSDLLETVFHGPQILDLALASAGDYGRPPMVGRMLILPLRSDLGDVTRALGCLIAEGETGQAPRRFDLTAHQVQPVIPGARTLDPSPDAPGLAEAAAAWRPPAPAAKAPASADAGAGRPPPRIASAEERRARFRVISGD